MQERLGTWATIIHPDCTPVLLSQPPSMHLSTACTWEF